MRHSAQFIRLSAVISALGVLAAALCLGAASAEETPRVRRPPPSAGLAEPSIEAELILPPPPLSASAAEAADLAAVRRVIAEASPARVAQARWDDAHEDPSAFYETIGGGFDLKTLPATAALFSVLMKEQGSAASAAKKRFPRLRPWAADASIQTCDPNDKPLGGYPSGHATMGYAVATALAYLIPEKAQALQARAADYAFSREVCGSHSPSDLEASHVLGVTVAVALLRSPSAAVLVKASKDELRARGFTRS